MRDRTPVQLYALAAGLALVGAGVAGLLYSRGLSGVDGRHNLVHLITGGVGLAAYPSYPRARAYAIGLGVLYLGFAVWGLVLGSGETILGLIPVNTEDTVLHTLLALAGFAAVLAGPSRRGAFGRLPQRP